MERKEGNKATKHWSDEPFMIKPYQCEGQILRDQVEDQSSSDGENVRVKISLNYQVTRTEVVNKEIVSLMKLAGQKRGAS